MNRDVTALRLRVWRRDSPDRHRLVDLVLNIAQARCRAWLAGEPGLRHATVALHATLFRPLAYRPLPGMG